MIMRLLTHPCDTAILASLHASSFATPWSAESIANLMAQPGTFAVVTEDEALGFILVRVAASESEVLTVAVTPAARRRGIASALIRRAAEHAVELGAKTLFLEVGCGNLAAKSLYFGLGFAEVGRRRAYYTNPDGRVEDAVVLGVEIPLSRVGKCMQLD